MNFGVCTVTSYIYKMSKSRTQYLRFNPALLKNMALCLISKGTAISQKMSTLPARDQTAYRCGWLCRASTRPISPQVQEIPMGKHTPNQADASKRKVLPSFRTIEKP